jgi:hypothetical protein
MSAIDAEGCKFKIIALRDLLFRKERMIRTEVPFLTKVRNPIDKDLANVIADWEEPGREGLRPLSANIACVVLNQLLFHVDMFEFERYNRAIAGADRITKAMSARLPRSISVSAGRAESIARICLIVGQALYRRAAATRDKLSGKGGLATYQRIHQQFCWTEMSALGRRWTLKARKTLIVYCF